jgi:death-on-curing family protein
MRLITLDEALAIHRNQIELYGGTHGIRDMGVLQSILLEAKKIAAEDPQVSSTKSKIAATYVINVVRSRPFTDGNLRTALGLLLVFTSLNGWDVARDANVPAAESERTTLEKIIIYAGSDDATPEEIEEIILNSFVLGASKP